MTPRTTSPKPKGNLLYSMINQLHGMVVGATPLRPNKLNGTTIIDRGFSSERNFDDAVFGSGADVTYTDQHCRCVPFLYDKSMRTLSMTKIVTQQLLTVPIRNLIHSGGDKILDLIRTGMMYTIKSSNIDLLTVQGFNHGLLIHSGITQVFSGFIRNAGRENVYECNAYDVSDKNFPTIRALTKAQETTDILLALMRRGFIHFDARKHLACVLVTLFGGDDNAHKSVEEFLMLFFASALKKEP